MTKSPFQFELPLLERKLGHAVQKKYGQVSRRAFLSGLTRKVFALAGVGLAAQVLPFFAKEAKAQFVSGALCGMHGYHCSSGCDGGSAGYLWAACCQIPVGTPPCPIVYACCHYVDYCGTRPPSWPLLCYSQNVGGTAWCGDEGDYICTRPFCQATYPSYAACFNNCQPHSCFYPN